MTAQMINKINRNAAAPRIMPMVQQIFHSKVIEMKELRRMAWLIQSNKVKKMEVRNMLE